MKDRKIKVFQGIDPLAGEREERIARALDIFEKTAEEFHRTGLPKIEDDIPQKQGISEPLDLDTREKLKRFEEAVRSVGRSFTPGEKMPEARSDGEWVWTAQGGPGGDQRGWKLVRTNDQGVIRRTIYGGKKDGSGGGSNIKAWWHE